MDQGQRDVALRVTEVPMLEPEIVRQIRGLVAMRWGSKRVASTLGIGRGAARRYLRGATPGEQQRPRARRLDADQRTVVIDIAKDGSMKINSEPTDETRLGPRLEEIFKTRAERVVFVKGDPDLEYQYVAKAIDIAHGAGIDRVGLMTPEMEAGR